MKKAKVIIVVLLLSAIILSGCSGANIAPSAGMGQTAAVQETPVLTPTPTEEPTPTPFDSESYAAEVEIFKDVDITRFKEPNQMITSAYPTRTYTTEYLMRVSGSIVTAELLSSELITIENRGDESIWIEYKFRCIEVIKGEPELDDGIFYMKRSPATHVAEGWEITDMQYMPYDVGCKYVMFMGSKPTQYRYDPRPYYSTNCFQRLFDDGQVGALYMAYDLAKLRTYNTLDGLKEKLATAPRALEGNFSAIEIQPTVDKAIRGCSAIVKATCINAEDETFRVDRVVQGEMRDDVFSLYIGRMNPVEGQRYLLFVTRQSYFYKEDTKYNNQYQFYAKLDADDNILGGLYQYDTKTAEQFATVAEFEKYLSVVLPPEKIHTSMVYSGGDFLESGTLAEIVDYSHYVLKGYCSLSDITGTKADYQYARFTITEICKDGQTTPGIFVGGAVTLYVPIEEFVSEGECYLLVTGRFGPYRTYHSLACRTGAVIPADDTACVAGLMALLGR